MYSFILMDWAELQCQRYWVCFVGVMGFRGLTGDFTGVFEGCWRMVSRIMGLKAVWVWRLEGLVRYSSEAYPKG